MNFRLFITYIADHFVVVAGSTLALFFTTCMILLIRSIGTKSENESSGGSIDVTAIEGAMQRVLATQPQLSIVPRVAGADGDNGDGKADSTGQAQLLQDLQTLVKSRDAQVEKLSKEVAEARAFKTPPDGAPGVAKDAASGNLGDELNIYKAKIEELQARLAEYEIIEDDIADLSMFKEENARLKEEVNALKAGGAAPVAAVPAPAVAEANSAEPAPTPVDEAKAVSAEDQMAELLAAATTAAVPVPAALVPVAPDPAPAAPVEASADPLAEATNSEKMLSEVESLATAPEATEAAESALEDSLDTEKLLAEVDSLKGDGEDTDDTASNFKKAAEG